MAIIKIVEDVYIMEADTDKKEILVTEEGEPKTYLLDDDFDESDLEEYVGERVKLKIKDDRVIDIIV